MIKFGFKVYTNIYLEVLHKKILICYRVIIYNTGMFRINMNCIQFSEIMHVGLQITRTSNRHIYIFL